MTPIARNALSRQLLEAAAAQLGIDRRTVHNTAVLLYENFYISYPYSNATTLDAASKSTVARTLRVIERALPGLVADRQPDPDSPVFVEPYGEPHHAIIPWAHPQMWRLSLADLAPEAPAIYRLIAEAYIAAVTLSRVPAGVPA